MNTLQQPESTTFNLTIPSHRIGELEHRIITLNKKAAKNNIQPIQLVKGKEKVVSYTQTTNDENGTNETVIDVLVTSVVITFYPIKAAGNWIFKASIEHEVINEQYHNVISGYNITQDEEKVYRHVPSACEHCQVNRFRNQTFIVKNSSGEFKQVGSSCIEEFLGMNVQGAIASLAIMSSIASFGDADEFGMSGGSAPRLASIRDTVAYSIAQINLHGFVSATKAREESEMGYPCLSTGSIVLNQLFRSKYMKEEDRLIVTSEHFTQADEIIKKWNDELIPAFDKMDDSLDTFQYKLALAVSLGHVKERLHNIVVGAVHHTLKKMREDKAPKSISLDEFIPGTIKDKIKILLTIVKMYKFEGAYGTTTILFFIDKDGRKVVWFASGSLDEKEWEVGKTFMIKASIKDFKNDSKFGKQTIITRASKVSIDNSQTTIE